MKKKMLAMLLAAAIVVQPLSVAGAAEFTDGSTETVEEFTAEFDDGMDEVPEVEEVDVSVAAVAPEPEQVTVKVGDNANATFYYGYYEEFGQYYKTLTKTVISGTGEMWDYLKDGATLDKQKNPFNDNCPVSLIIEDGITHVSDYLLYNSSSPYQITLGKDIKSIGKFAFYSSYNLSEIELPEGLETIGEGGFARCTELQKVELPDSVVSLGNSCFYACRKLKSVKLSNLLNNLPEDCFLQCDLLNNVTVPGNIETVNSRAFGDCFGLDTIEFQDGIKTIGGYVFNGCTKLNNVNLPGTIKEIGIYAFADCSNLSEIKLSEGLESIGRKAFENCIRLKEIEIPRRETTIGSGADEWEDSFYGCENLQTIKGYACSGAKKYYNSLTADKNESIEFVPYENEAVHQWTNKKIIKQPTCTENGIQALECDICGTLGEEEEINALGHDWNNGVIITQPTEITEGVKKYTCWRCEETMEESIPKLSPIRFEYTNVSWNRYDELYVNASTNKPVYYYVEYANENEPAPAFDENKLDKTTNATKYISTTISSVPSEKIVIYVFAVDTDGNNTYITLKPEYFGRPDKPSNEVKIGENIIATISGDTLTISGTGRTYDFDDTWYNADKSKITKVVFEGNITYLGESVLQGFVSLKEITFPEGIESMGDGVVRDCVSLEKIVFPTTLKVIPDMFHQEWDGNNSLVTVIIPEGVEALDIGALRECKQLQEVEIPESVTSIDIQAFSECYSLKKIIIPKSVVHFGYEVFRNCDDLTINGFRDSVAEHYAIANNIPFVSSDFKVVFKENGKTLKTQYIMKGETATPPTLTARPGYTLTWDGDYTNIQEDMIINAVWTKDGADKPNPPIIVYPPSTTKYTVTFKDRGEVVKTEKVPSGENADYPYLYRYGYKLSWDKDFSNVTSNITVNAVWAVITPAKVTSLTAEILPKYVRLSWDRAEYADYYLIYRKAVSENAYKQVAKTTGILWTDKKVSQGTEYQYKVAAVSAVDGKKYQGKDSDVAAVKTGAPENGSIYTVGKLNYIVLDSNKVSVAGMAKVTGKVSIPNTVAIAGKVFKVTSIESKAFYRNKHLIDLKIGNNVTYVGPYSFYQCPNLETAKFGSRVQVISTCAFTQCPKLGNITLPERIERLGAKLFYQCKSMKTLTIKTTKLNYLGTKALAINSKAVIKVPKSKYSSYVKLISKSGKYSAMKIQKF